MIDGHFRGDGNTRSTTNTSYPCASRSSTHARPALPLPPVTTIRFFSIHHGSSCSLRPITIGRPPQHRHLFLVQRVHRALEVVQSADDLAGLDFRLHVYLMVDLRGQSIFF